MECRPPSLGGNTGASDSFTVQLVGTNLQVLNNGVIVDSRPVAAVTSLTINGENGQNDTLTLDFTGGNPFQANFVLNFNGGTGGNDRVTLMGGNATDVTYMLADPGAGNGNGTLTLNGVDFNNLTVNVTGLEPLLVTTSAANVTIDLSALGAGEDLTLQDVGTNNDQMSQVNFANNNLEDITFANPTGSFVITGSASADTIHINALDTLDNTGAALSATLTVNAGNGDDVIDFNAKTSSGTYTFNGEVGANDELQGRDAVQIWNITGADAGNIGGAGVVDFATIENLTGGNNSDTFNVANGTSISGTINAGAGNDVLDIDGNGLVNTFNGGANSDTINEAGVATVAVTLTTAIDGTISRITNPYTSVEALIGNNTNSTLNLPATGTTTVSVTGQNDGTVMNGGTMNFTDFNLLVGGAGNDNITVQAGGSLTSATINGGAGNDTLTVDFTGNVPLAGGTLTFNGGENAGDNDEVVVTGYNFTAAGFVGGSADVTVNHTGAETGNVVIGPVGTVLGTINFNEIEPLILAGSAADLVINLPDVAGTPNSDVRLANDTAANFPGNGTDIATRSAIDSIVLNTFEYTEFVNPTNTFRVNLGNQGDTIQIRSLDGAFAPAAGTTIQGGDGADTFNFQSGATNIDLKGGNGADVFDIASALNGGVDGEAGLDRLQGTLIGVVVLTGAALNGFSGTEGSLSGFANIERIDADVATASSLTGIGTVSTWSLNGGTTGTYDDTVVLTPQLTYNDFDTLIGGNLDDTFNMTANSAFNLVGQGGIDTFDIDFVLTGTISGGTENDVLQGNRITDVTLTNTAADADGYSGLEADITSFTGINTITASGVTDAMLTGENVVSTWTLNSPTSPHYDDLGTVNGGTGVLNFFGFETLNGGTAADTFLISIDPNDGVGTTGTTLNGGAGADVFDLNVALLGQLNGNGVGPATDVDVLMGNLIDAVVLVSSDDTGFSGTENSITPVAGNGFTGIDAISASTTMNSRLTGENATAVWTINGGASTYNDLTRTLTIDTDFDSLLDGNIGNMFLITGDSDFDLLGGLGVDTFNVDTGIILTGFIDGDDGVAADGAVDVLTGTGINDVTLTSSQNTGVNDGFFGDEPSINGGFRRIGNITGTANGTLRGEAAAAAATSTWTLDGTNPIYSDGANTLNFSGFATLQGRDGVDLFNVTGASDYSLNGGDGDDVFDLDATLTATNSTGSIDGGLGTDRLQGTTISTGVLTAAGVNGFAGTQGSIPGNFTGINTLIGTSTGTLTGFAAVGVTQGTWTLDSANANTYTDSATGQVLTLLAGVTPGFVNLRGGAGIDTFNVLANATVTLFGGAGVDDFNFLANGIVLTGNIDGEANGAELDFSTRTTGVDITLSGAGGTIGLNGDDSAGFIGGTFFNITSLIGEAGGGNLLTGAAGVPGIWAFGATSTYSIGAGSVTFTNFEEAHGGSGNDTFNVSAAPLIPLFGGGGDDTLAVDFANGAFNVTFDGEGQTTSDNVTVANNTFATTTYNVTGVGAGNLVFTGAANVTTNSPNGTITFTGLEPATITSTLGTVTINVDPGNVFAGTITTTVSSAGGLTTVAFDNGAESLVFSNPTVELIINGDTADIDVITFNSMVGFTASLTIDAGGNGGDRIDVTQDLLLGSVTATGDLTLTAETVNLSAASIRTDNVAAAGSVTLDATTINIDANLTIDTNNGTDGTLDVVNSRIDAVAGGAQSLTLDLGDSSFADNNAVANDYSTVAITSANDVTLTETNAINLGTVVVTGTLTITANGLVDFTGGASAVGALDINTTNAGAITDTGAGALTVTGTATLSAGAANNITLNNANNFSTVVLTDGLNVTLNDTDAITLATSPVTGTSAVAGNLSVTAAGLVDFSGPGTTTVGAALSITTSAGGITDSNPIGLLVVTGTATLARANAP